MRATPITVAALAAALLLTACDSSGGDSDSTDKNKAGGACTLDAVGVQVAASAAPSAGDTGNVTVTLTNRGSKCTLNGFPAVDLQGGKASGAVPADKAAKAQKLTQKHLEAALEKIRPISPDALKEFTAIHERMQLDR